MSVTTSYGETLTHKFSNVIESKVFEFDGPRRSVSLSYDSTDPLCLDQVMSNNTNYVSETQWLSTDCPFGLENCVPGFEVMLDSEAHPTGKNFLRVQEFCLRGNR